MAMFAIGDTHLSLNSNKPMTVFPGWDDYVERLEKNWRALVAPEDTVVICGDISWAMSLDEALTDFTFLHGLPGTKLLLKGNHDYWWGTRRRMDAFLAEHGLTSLRIVHNDAVLVDGTMAVCGTRGWACDAEGEADRRVLEREVGRLRTSVRAAKQTGGEPIAFLHYPPIFAGQSCPELLGVLREEGVRRCYYGHVHGAGIRLAFSGEVDGLSLRLVSADALHFVPLLIRPSADAGDFTKNL